MTQKGVNLPVGNICVFRYDKQSPWGEKENKILASFSKRISDEIIAIHDREMVAPRHDLQAELVGNFIYQDLAAAPSPAHSSDSSPHSQPSVAMSAILGLQNTANLAASAQRERPYDEPLRNTARLVGASFAALLDVRALERGKQKFDCVRRGLQRRHSIDGKTAQMAGQAADWHEHVGGGVAVIGLHAVDEADGEHLESLLQSDVVVEAVQAAASKGEAGEAELEEVLSRFVPELFRSSLVVPVHGQSGLALVALVSAERRQAFDEGDLAFVEQMATLCLAALTKQRLAKTTRSNVAFIAKISHELRTPMHGLAGQLHLLREAYTEAERSGDELRQVGPLLKEAEECFGGLQVIVDDAIAFARLGEDEQVDEKGQKPETNGAS